MLHHELYLFLSVTFICENLVLVAHLNFTINFVFFVTAGALKMLTSRFSDDESMR